MDRRMDDNPTKSVFAKKGTYPTNDFFNAILDMGFYDRFFSSLHKDAKRIGISLFKPCKGIENISEYDIPLTHCVTPNKTYSF